MTAKEFLEHHKCNFDAALHSISMRDRWSAFGLLWEEAQKQPWFDDFVDKRIGYRPFVDYGVYHVFIERQNIKPTQFAALLKDFLEKAGGVISLDEHIRLNRAKRAAHRMAETDLCEDRNDGRRAC